MRAMTMGVIGAMLWLSLTHAAGARQTQTPTAPETAAVARGVELLNQGDTAAAAALATQLLQQYPKSVPVLALAIDATVATRGAAAALDLYERWIGPQPKDQRDVLPRLAIAFLRESGRDRSRPSARLEALQTLFGIGDQAAPMLVDADPGPSIDDTSILASRGDDRAINKLVDDLKDPLANRRAVILALGRTHSASAVKALADTLNDPDPIWRAAAAESLGKIGLPAAIPLLKPLLADRMFTVQFVAATALFELGDVSGLPLIRSMETSEHAGIRLAAANATKSRPDQAWVLLVQKLTADSDPSIRRQAADLLAPQDPAAARAVLLPLLEDENPAERQAAADSYVRVSEDVLYLRRQLHSPDPLTRVRAAARLLEVAR